MAIDDDPFEILENQQTDNGFDLLGLSSSAGAVTAVAFQSPALAIASATLTAFDRLFSNKNSERAMLFRELVKDEFRRVSKRVEHIQVRLDELQSAIQLATRYDAAEFNDKKRNRYIRVLSNSLLSDTKVDDLSNYIRAIESLGESDIIGLKVLNRVMNKAGDWNYPAQNQGSVDALHPNTFIQRAQELAVQMATDFGKWPPTSNNEFSREEGLQICLRLQGLGLAQEIQTGARQVPIANYSARLTPRGLMLLRLLGEEVPNWERYFNSDGPR